MTAFRKLLTLAQQRANNTGHTQHVVITVLQTSETFQEIPKVQQHPDWKSSRLIETVEPQKWVRMGLRLRRKTRGGNRVRVGGNVR